MYRAISTGLTRKEVKTKYHRLASPSNSKILAALVVPLLCDSSWMEL